MSLKAVFDAAGALVCYGPNDDNYAPNLANGQTLQVVEDNDPRLVAHAEVAGKAATLQSFESAVQIWLDQAAQTRGYDGILSAVSYATSKHPRFGPEGIAYRDWRDAVWTYCYQALADVQAGKRPLPEVKALLAELPPAPVFT